MHHGTYIWAATRQVPTTLSHTGGIRRKLKHVNLLSKDVRLLCINSHCSRDTTRDLASTSDNSKRKYVSIKPREIFRAHYSLIALNSALGRLVRSAHCRIRMGPILRWALSSCYRYMPRREI